MTVELPADLEDFIHSRVSCGQYASSDDAVAAAVRRLMQEEKDEDRVDGLRPASAWTESDSARARQIWAEYQRDHDVSALLGKAAGIDPVDGRVWFGESATDIARQSQAEGIDSPFYCVRVGYEYYVRKGGHR